jgi:hypothetical protein
MLTIKRVVEMGTCVFCNREKEVCAVVMDGQSHEVQLCWADVKKHAQMRMRMNGVPAKPAAAVPVGNGAGAVK